MTPKIVSYPFGDRVYRSTLYYGQRNVLTLQTLPEKSVHCVVTSPPYWNLRDYGTATWEGGDPTCAHDVERTEGPKQTQGAQSGHASAKDKLARRICQCGAQRVDSQIGLEETPEEFVASMVDVFREVWRVLRDDGTLWLNLGDSYASQGGKGEQGATSQRLGRSNVEAQEKAQSTRPPPGLKAKDLAGIPWRVALGLQADGWYLRSDIIWAKGSCMPESVTDRPTRSHEYLFLLTKSDRYFYDSEAIREPASWGDVARNGTAKGLPARPGQPAHTGFNKRRTEGGDVDAPTTRNKRTVWNVNPRPYKGAHFAVFPSALVEPCVRAGTSEKGCCPTCGAPWVRVVETSGGRDWRSAEMVDAGIPGARAGEGSNKRGRSKEPLTHTKTRHDKGWEPSCECEAQEPVPCVVMDPFSGSGTLGFVANRERRDYIGLDLNPDYLPLAEARILGQEAPSAEDPAPSETPNVFDLFEAMGG